jgi:hypothetical protein
LLIELNKNHIKNTLFAILFFIPVLEFPQVIVQENDRQSLWKGITGYELVSQRSNDKVEYALLLQKQPNRRKIRRIIYCVF